MILFLMINDTEDRDKRKQLPSLGGRGSIENKSTQNKVLTKLLYLRKKFTQIFFILLIYIWKGRSKKFLPTSLDQALQSEIWES